MKKSIPYSLSAILVTTLLTGCVPITSKLNLNPATGQATWTSPKDVTVASIDAYVDTNGNKHLTVTDWKSSNNPEVLKAKGDADAAVAKVYVDGILQAVQAGMSAYTTMGASAVTTAALNATQRPIVIQQPKAAATPATTTTTTPATTAP